MAENDDELPVLPECLILGNEGYKDTLLAGRRNVRMRW